MIWASTKTRLTAVVTVEVLTSHCEAWIGYPAIMNWPVLQCPFSREIGRRSVDDNDDAMDARLNVLWQLDR